MEAEWVSQELAESVKLVQQYRTLYLSAVFVALGWVLGQLLGTGNEQATADTSSRALQLLRERTDVALVLCFIPLANVLFAFLLLETAAHIRTLARYRFILGYELGGQSPAWRWEIWKSSRFGSTRGWTAPLNIFFTVFLIVLSISALWFAHPAVKSGNSLGLSILWLAGMAIPSVLLIISAITGFRYRHRNHVALVPEQHEQWQQLSAIQPNPRGWTADFRSRLTRSSMDSLPRPLLLLLLLLLILLNVVVLLGQLWPEGAPPFARAVNIGFLVLSLAVFCALLFRRPPP